MNSKSKIWQIVLLVLLVLAIAAILFFNSKLNASKESLSNTMAQLSEEQANSAALQADLDAAKADYDDVTAKLEAAEASAEALSAEVETGKATAEQLEADLTAANGRVTELETAATASEAKIAELETAATESEAKIAELTTAAGEKDTKIAELEAAVAEKDQTIESLSAAAGTAVNDAVAGVKTAEEKLVEAQAALESAVDALAAKPGDTTEAPVDAEAVKAAVNAVVADESKTAEEKLEALDEIRQEVAEKAPDAELPESFKVEPEKPKDETPEAKGDGDALTAAVASVEEAITKVAAQQAVEGDKSEAVAAVDLDAVRAEVEAIIADGSKTVEEQTEALKAIEEKLTEALPEDAGDEAARMEEVQAQLDAAEDEVEKLSAELVEQLATIDTLNEQIAALDAQAETDATQLSDLQSQLADSTAQAEAKSAELAEAQATYENSLAEVEAYRVKRDPASGEAHIATAVDNVINVAEDGVTAAWQYANSDLSGNAATLSLVLDGETIYTSGALKPGEVIDSIALDKPLEPGVYQAMAVTTVYDKDGEVQLTSRVPVTLNVAE